MVLFLILPIDTEASGVFAKRPNVSVFSQVSVSRFTTTTCTVASVSSTPGCHFHGKWLALIGRLLLKLVDLANNKHNTGPFFKSL